MTLQDLRKRRQPLIRVLAPVLLTAWISAAAAPCIAMTAGGHGEATAAPHEHHAMAPTDLQPAEGASHHAAGCPHCGPSSGDRPGGDSAAHARCASADTVNAKDASAKLAKRDLATGLVATELYTVSSPLQQTVRRAVPGRSAPEPLLPRHLRFCVFLN